MQRLITGRITLYFHNEPRAKKKGSAGRSWPAGRSLDTPGVMAIVLTLGRALMLIICAYGPQSRRPDTKKVPFYNKMAREWDFGSSSEIIVSLGDFN